MRSSTRTVRCKCAWSRVNAASSGRYQCRYVSLFNVTERTPRSTPCTTPHHPQLSLPLCPVAPLDSISSILCLMVHCHRHIVAHATCLYTHSPHDASVLFDCSYRLSRCLCVNTTSCGACTRSTQGQQEEQEGTPRRTQTTAPLTHTIQVLVPILRRRSCRRGATYR